MILSHKMNLSLLYLSYLRCKLKETCISFRWSQEKRKEENTNVAKLVRWPDCSASSHSPERTRESVRCVGQEG